jgi:plastocyanin
MSCAVAVLALNTPAPCAEAGGTDGKRVTATVMFGAGLNTTQPGNAANHHILPQAIRVKTGGVVNFVVAGFHQILIYSPGKRSDDVVVPASGTFINDLGDVYYTGILPAGGPPAIPATVSPSNASNRVEPVSFAEAGTYLVICNVRTHFLNGMYAYVTVGDDEDNNGDGHSDHSRP